MPEILFLEYIPYEHAGIQMTLDTIETDEINLLSNAQDVGIWV
jgi:hypothetical protein